MTRIRTNPCEACPYRCDVPSGLWGEEEYDKLPPYDGPTSQQPMGGFACHASPEQFCHGWAVTHTSRGHDCDLLSLRMAGCPSIPPSSVPLFASGAEAAEHGKRDIDNPSPEATELINRLLGKYERLQEGNMQ